MKSRMEKYYDENNQYIQKRTSKNSNLYREITNTELKDFNLASNAKVIGENESDSVNVDRLKEILEKNYQGVSKRSQVKLVPEIEEEELELEKTKEYDINTILEKAREAKEVDYEKERLKKLRDTQYDILKQLDINDEDEEKEGKAVGSKTKEELLNLINTITENELQKTKLDLDPLDILSDLKGDENTVVMGAKEFNEDLQLEEEKQEKEQKNKADESFYSNSLTFSQSDFDDFNDLKDEVAANKIVIKILIVLVVIALIVGTVIFINSFFNLGLF